MSDNVYLEDGLNNLAFPSLSSCYFPQLGQRFENVDKLADSLHLPYLLTTII